MTLGPDGNVWFVDGNSQVVGRVSPAGSVSYFAMPVQLAGGAQTIAAGPDHNLWVLGRGDNASQHDWVLRVSVDGVVTKFPTPGIDVSPESITAGPDGNLWFTEFSVSKVARITPAGDVAEYSIVNQDAHPRGITTGHDGNLWFAEDDRSRPTIGRISPQGVETEFHLDQMPTNATPDDIVAGADGNLWITRWTGEGFGHMSPKGEYVAVALPQGSRAEKAIVGPDGSIWFTDPGKNAIGRVSAAGVIREFPVPRSNSYLDGLAVGADGRIWFGEGTRIASIGVKVPEAAFSERVAIYPGLTSQTVSVMNTGEAALAITGVTLTGVDRNAFVIGPDTCSGKSVNSGARCDITVSHTASGPAGVVQSALLEVSDNATASPQKVSLVAQLRGCKLPVVDSSPNELGHGLMIDTTTGRELNEPLGAFTNTASPSRVNTVAEPVLPGVSAGYYDRPQRRWLPVPRGDWISPDGARYAYIPFDAPGTTRVLHIVDVATGREHALPLSPGFWTVVAFTDMGVYVQQAYEGIAPGLSVVDPDSGSMRGVLEGKAVHLVRGTTAWFGDRNPADTLPQWGMGGGSNEVGSIDLVTGSTRTWLYVPGSQLYVIGTVNGAPVVEVGQQNSSQLFVVTSPIQPKSLDLPFTPGESPSLSGFVSDPQGTWVGSPDGVYLWTERTGGILVSTAPAVPAGTCA